MADVAQETPLDNSITMKSDKTSITIGALIQVFFTLISRVFGMIRDVMVSHIFGAGAVTDAFIAAFTIPNVLRQFFGEGAFSVAFVPIYVGVREKDGEHEAKRFFRHAFGLLAVSLMVVTALGMLFSKSLILLFAYGFSENPEQLALANHMTRWLFPYVFMVSLVALFGAYLACFKRFAAMAFAPVLLNLTMIVFMVWGIDAFRPPIMTLVASVFVGGILQVALMVFVLVRLNLWAPPALSFSTEPMKQLMRMLGPALFGVFVYQLNIIVLRQLASFLGEGQITYYYNADRLAQFATGVFAVSIATAALPELSRGIARYGHGAFFDILRFTLTMSSFILTPCAAGLLAFAYPVITVIFVHGGGAFSAQDALITAHTLMAFSPSLIAFGWSRPLIQAFYAQGDTRTPVKVGVVTVIVNVVIGWCMLRYEVIGLALTLSISSFIQFLFLSWLFKRKNPEFCLDLFRPFFSHVVASSLACVIGMFIGQYGQWHLGFTLINALILCILSGSAALSYFCFAYLLKIPEARKFITNIRSRIFK